MLCLLVSLLLWGLVLAIVWWIISMIPVPAPFGWVIQVVFAIVCLVVIFNLLEGGGRFAMVCTGNRLLI